MFVYITRKMIRIKTKINKHLSEIKIEHMQLNINFTSFYQNYEKTNFDTVN